MPGTAGKKARLKFSVTTGGAGVYNVVAGIKQISCSIDGQTVDDSEMSVDWVQNIAGLLGAKVTASGNRRLSDANGQNAILAAMLAGTQCYIQVLPDNGTTVNTGFKMEVIITKFGPDSDVAGANSISIEFVATGAVTLM